MAELLPAWEQHLEIPTTGSLCPVSSGKMGALETGASWALGRTCLSSFAASTGFGILLPARNMCGQDLESRRKKVVGEPYEGKPHVRFEVAGNGNQAHAQAPFPDPTSGRGWRHTRAGPHAWVGAVQGS